MSFHSHFYFCYPLFVVVLVLSLPIIPVSVYSASLTYFRLDVVPLDYVT